MLRRSGNKLDAVPATVLSPPEFELEERWNAYREFEVSAMLNRSEHFEKFIDTVLNAQPAVEYFDGRFRRRFDQQRLGTDAQVCIAPSVLVRRVAEGFKLKDYIETCTDALNLTDAIILGPKRHAPCIAQSDHAVWVYATVANSRLLGATSLYEARLEAHCVALVGDLLFISDTTGTLPDDLIQEHTTSLGAQRLASLFSGDARITSVSTQNSIPFDAMLRGADLRGADLSLIPASLTDSVHVCRTARGTSSADGRRYVGFQRGRVRQEIPDAQRKAYDVDAFLSWVRALAPALSTATTINNSVLSRYLQTCPAPAVVQPASVSFDPPGEVRFVDSTNRLLQIKALSADVTNVSSEFYTCTLTFEVVGKKSSATVDAVLPFEFQRAKGRFWFKKDGRSSVSVLYEHAGQTRSSSFSDYLNRNQENLLIGLQGGATIYQGQNFYEVDYTHAETELIACIKPITYPAVYSEKGTKTELADAKARRVKRFLPRTLFRFLAASPKAVPFKSELLVCADLGTECADFVAVNFTRRQLAFIHAKVGNSTGISASAFHDLVAQAQKNLVYFAPGDSTPEGVKTWKSSAFWNKTLVPKLVRSDAGLPTGAALWERIRHDILSAANRELHVVLATAGCCDQALLESAIKTPSERTAETGQLLHLLNGLSGATQQLGAKLTVLQLPYGAAPMP